MAEGITVTTGANNHITFSNVPSGRWHSFPLKINGTNITGENDQICESSDLGEFTIFKNSALHVDLGVRQSAGALEFRCAYMGLPFTVNLNYDRSENAIISSSSTLNSSLFLSAHSPSMPAGGKGYVAFVNDGQVYRKNFITGDIKLVSKGAGSVRGNNPSQSPGISSDGRFVVLVVFASSATNLVTGSSDQQIYTKEMVLE